MNNEFYIANLGFILEYTDGTTDDEIQYELYKMMFQSKDMVHYDRSNGGGFENLEQQTLNEYVVILMLKDMIESVYRLNEERNFNPYIVVGYNDIQTVIQGTTFNVDVGYRVLQDLQQTGVVKMEF